MPLPRYFEKLAHKHYSHFYATQNFHDFKERKALYRPFKEGEENREIADLFAKYKILKEQKIEELTKEWEEFVAKQIEEETIPDFVQSGANALHDLKNRQHLTDL